MSHTPVLLHEAVAALAPRNGEIIVDATFGGGGYSRALLETADCKVIALDRDPDAIARAQAFARLAPWRLDPREGRFGDLADLVPEPVDGVALDLGLSSFQLDEPERGFSFRFDAPLDMRMGKRGPSAADAIARLSEEALAEAIWIYGEEPASRRIARAILEARRESAIASTMQLADLVEKALGGRRGARVHPATRTFQALRILVNDELGEIARALAAAELRLKPGGRLVVVSFHSLEDRLVKNFMTERSGGGGGGSRHAPVRQAMRAPTFSAPLAKAVAPSDIEIAANPRARSARLRLAVRSQAPAWDVDPANRSVARLAQAEWEKIAMKLALNDLGGRWFVPVACAVIAVMAVGVFKAKSDAAAARKRVTALEESVAASRDEARGLAAEVQFLENPRRIEALSRRELGMAPAERGQRKDASALPPVAAPKAAEPQR